MQFCINTYLVCKNIRILRQFTSSSWVHWLQSCAISPNIFFFRPTEINPKIWKNWYLILSTFCLIYNSSCYTFVFPQKKFRQSWLKLVPAKESAVQKNCCREKSYHLLLPDQPTPGCMRERFRVTILLRTTFMRSWCNWRTSSVAA